MGLNYFKFCVNIGIVMAGGVNNNAMKIFADVYIVFFFCCFKCQRWFCTLNYITMIILRDAPSQYKRA